MSRGPPRDKSQRFNERVVCRLRVEDDQGHVQSGIARIGSKTLGTAERTIDVQLDLEVRWRPFAPPKAETSHTRSVTINHKQK